MSPKESKTTTRPTSDAVPNDKPATPAATETRGARLSRKARRVRFHLYALFTVALFVCLVALVIANTRQVKLNWVFGSSTASLVWIVLFSAILGWLLGIVMSALFRWRTRAPRA
ncbi:MAG: LapA family protein [Gaiellaceae bacterium]